MTNSKPKPNPAFPLTEGFFWYDETGGIKRSTTELYFPSIFSELVCKITKMHFELQSIKVGLLEFDFEITSATDLPKNLYVWEEWKYMATENFINSLNWRIDTPNDPVPLFALILNRNLRVSSANITINGQQEIVLFDQTVDMAFMPNSYPPNPSIVDPDENYVFYEKKMTAFYANLEMNQKYHLSIELDGQGPNFEHAPLFPYWKIRFVKATYWSSTDIGVDTSFQRVSPIISKHLPQALSQKLYKGSWTPFVTRIKPAGPYRGDEVAFLPNGTYGLPNLVNSKNLSELWKITIPAEEIIDLSLTGYQTLRTVFSIIITEHKKIDITVKTPRTPIPSRIYEQLKNLDRYDDVLVDYQILNLSKERRKIVVETEIVGFTDIVRENFMLPWMEDPDGKRPTLSISQTPWLKRGILRDIVNHEKATLSCKVIDEDSKDILYHKTFRIDVLPHDQMLFGLSSLSSSTNYNLAPFLGAWITPNDKEWLLDAVRAGSAWFHPNHYIYIVDHGSLSEIDQVVGAVFAFLKKEWLHYVNQPFTSKMVADSQRVLLPEVVLKHKVGNCIDLTVTFASILEGFGIYSLVFLTSEHAFIGWGNKDDVNKMMFLETTMIWTDTYENAKNEWEAQFRKNFLLQGPEVLMPQMLIHMSRWCQILELWRIRNSGIARHD